MSEVIASELNVTIYKPDKTLNITFRDGFKPGRKRVGFFFFKSNFLFISKIADDCSVRGLSLLLKLLYILEPVQRFKPTPFSYKVLQVTTLIHQLR